MGRTTAFSARFGRQLKQMGTEFSRHTPQSISGLTNESIVHELSEKTPRTAIYLHQSNYDGTALVNILMSYSLVSILNTYDQSISPELGEGEEDAEVPQSIEKQRYEDFVKKFKDDLAEQQQQEQEQQQPQPPSRPVSQQFPESIALPAPDMDLDMAANQASKKFQKLAEQLENEIALLHKNGLSEQARMIQSRKEDLILPFLCNPNTTDAKKLKSQRTQLQKKVWGVAEAILTLNGEVARVSLSESIDGKVVSNDNMARIGAEIEKALPLRGRGVRSNRNSSSSSSSSSVGGEIGPPPSLLELNPHLERNLELQSDWAATAPGRCPGSHLLLGSGNRFTPKANVSPADITRFIVVRVNKKTLHGFKLRAKREALDGISKYYLQIQMNFAGPLPDDAVQALHRVLKVCNGHNVAPEGQGIFYNAGVGLDRDDPGVDLNSTSAADVVDYMTVVHPAMHLNQDHLDGPEVKKQRLDPGLGH